MNRPPQTVVCIGGWGSRRQIFAPLLAAHFPQARHVYLAWWQYAALDAATRGPALLAGFRRSLQQSDDVLLLGWSLGSLLALELALALDVCVNTVLHRRLRLVLLAPTASLCGPVQTASNVVSPKPVNPLLLQNMQRQLRQPSRAKTVLANFAGNCQGPNALKAPTGELSFGAVYQEQAGSFLQQEDGLEQLCSGLDYLMQCNLAGRLCALSFPCLLVVGQEDAIVPAWQGVALSALLPRAQLCLLAAGHNLLWPPAPGLETAVAEFLSSKALFGVDSS